MLFSFGVSFFLLLILNEGGPGGFGYLRLPVTTQVHAEPCDSIELSPAQYHTIASQGCTQSLGVNIGEGVTAEMLHALSALTHIEYSLVLAPNAALTNVSGLGQLRSVGGSVRLHGVEALTSLSGMGSLARIGENVDIQNCSALTALGWAALTSVAGIVVQDNPALEALLLPALTWVTDGAFLTFRNNAALAHVDELAHVAFGTPLFQLTFENLPRFGRFAANVTAACLGYYTILEFVNCTALTDLSGFQNAKAPQEVELQRPLVLRLENVGVVDASLAALQNVLLRELHILNCANLTSLVGLRRLGLPSYGDGTLTLSLEGPSLVDIGLEGPVILTSLALRNTGLTSLSDFNVTCLISLTVENNAHLARLEFPGLSCVAYFTDLSFPRGGVFVRHNPVLRVLRMPVWALARFAHVAPFELQNLPALEYLELDALDCLGAFQAQDVPLLSCEKLGNASVGWGIPTPPNLAGCSANASAGSIVTSFCEACVDPAGVCLEWLEGYACLCVECPLSYMPDYPPAGGGGCIALYDTAPSEFGVALGTLYWLAPLVSVVALCLVTLVWYVVRKRCLASALRYPDDLKPEQQENLGLYTQRSPEGDGERLRSRPQQQQHGSNGSNGSEDSDEYKHPQPQPQPQLQPQPHQPGQGATSPGSAGLPGLVGLAPVQLPPRLSAPAAPVAAAAAAVAHRDVLEIELGLRPTSRPDTQPP